MPKLLVMRANDFSATMADLLRLRCMRAINCLSTERPW